MILAGVILNWALRYWAGRTGLDPEPVSGALVALTLLSAIAGGVLGWRHARTRALRRESRLVRASQANAFEYHRANRLRPAGLAADPRPGHHDLVLPPGAVFRHGGGRDEDEHFVSISGRETRFGNYSYRLGTSGDTQTTISWGYVAVRLDAPLPHLVLDAKRNNGLLATRLPELFARDQVLSLEGDFDHYFTLYAPLRYERDALYIFTPDLMAALIDEGSDYGVEIIDDWVIFATEGPIDFTRPENWNAVFRLVDVAAAKLVRRSERYRDERAGHTPEDPPPAAAPAPGADPAAAAARAKAAGLAARVASLARTDGGPDTSRAALPGERIGSSGRRLRRSRAPWIVGGVIVAGLAVWAAVSDGLGG